jgi:hypothetical protein
MLPVLLTAVAIAASPAGAVVRLEVRPAAAPRPAMRYHLLPEVQEMQPGNPVQWYVRSFAEQRNFFYGKEAVAQRASYLAMPLAELPAAQLVNYGGSALTQTDWAARLDTPDWQVLDRVQTEGTDLRLPELDSLRRLGEALRVRFRGEVARKDFDDCVRSAKTMFALARHLGEFPAPEANRLGLTVAGLALDTLEEMVAQPGCPNLYWALTDLPTPLVEIRKGVQGARAVGDAELRAIRDDAAMTPEQLEQLVTPLSGRVGYEREQAGRPPRNLRAELNTRANDADALKAARARLITGADSLVRVAQFPPLQVVLLDARREFEARRDEDAKLVGLAPWQIESLAGKTPPAAGLFADMLPAVLDLRRAQGRVEQRVALLRYVEAVRLYAAAHAGKLPATLADIEVPLPADPFTGKAFHYVLKDGTARLCGGAPTGATGPAYEIRIGK